MGIQRFFIFGLYGIIIFNIASVVKYIYFKHISSSLTCNTFEKDLGIPVLTCPVKLLSTYCGRVLSDVDISQGLVLGRKRDNVYLSIGVISMENDEENLIQTLHSLSTHTSPLEYREVAIVAVLEGPESNKATVKRIEKDFQNEVEDGLIQVVSPTSDFFKTVDRERRLEWAENVPFTDGFKTKMANANERLVFLFEYCFQMSKNFVLLTDQAHAVRPYFSLIKEKVESFEKENVTSYVHDFGKHKLSGLGRLYSKKVIGDLAEFGSLFPVGRRTIDNVLQTFENLRRTVEITSQIRDTALFDMASKLHGVKPEVEFKAVSDFQKDHEFEKAFYEKGFAWIKAPEKGDSLIMVFKEAIRISRLRITSGSPLYRDILSDGVVMACESTAEAKGDEDSKCAEIGDFTDPVVDVNILESVVSYPVKSLKIVFTEDVKHWVIIREISIWQKE